MLVLNGGCGIEAGSGLCTRTALSLPPVDVSDPLAPLTLAARLTAGAKPVAGATVAFSVDLRSPALPNDDGGGIFVGKATSDADGVARYVREEGVDGLVLVPGDTLTGYEAGFTLLSKIGGVQYCRSHASGALTFR